MMVLFHRRLDFCVLTQALPCWALLSRRYAADAVVAPPLLQHQEFRNNLFHAGLSYPAATRLVRFLLHLCCGTGFP